LSNNIILKLKPEAVKYILQVLELRPHREVDTILKEIIIQLPKEEKKNDSR